ncbi:PREDICTED: immunoglobulin superfamily member 1-like [Pseudopodoces humilis]|uniref:immunoglobulin superfamily member 1-like n=1 Tax=Pseudopodoces humilis TaxID=181119 RepID=UPI0003956EA0|nr:PREDICTED: immunoglobulin superfamily member 1-like [Pseudopodoces humilis]
MLPVTHVLAFGAWLVAQSEATLSAPTISIFLKPPGVIPLGGSTTICCICQHSSGSFVLYKGSHRLHTQSGSRAEFSISNATSQDSGTYNCHYLQGGTVLARSEELEVFVEELRLPRPHLSVLPGHEVTAGADVMFHCSSTHPSTGCYLYLEGQIRAQLLPSERGDYNLSHVQNGDSGRYSCQCYTINASREWSAVSNTLDLVVRDYTLCNTVRLALAAALLLLLLLLLGPLTAGAARSRCWRSRC